MNLKSVLEDSGASLGSIVKVTCFLTDEQHFTKLNELFKEYFSDSPPVRSTPIVRLRTGLLFSIDAIAIAD